MCTFLETEDILDLYRDLTLYQTAQGGGHVWPLFGLGKNRATSVNIDVANSQLLFLN